MSPSGFLLVEKTTFSNLVWGTVVGYFFVLNTASDLISHNDKCNSVWSIADNMFQMNPFLKKGFQRRSVLIPVKLNVLKQLQNQLIFSCYIAGSGLPQVVEKELRHIKQVGRFRVEVTSSNESPLAMMTGTTLSFSYGKLIVHAHPCCKFLW